MKRVHFVVLVGTERVMSRAGPRTSSVCWAPCDSNAPTIIAPPQTLYLGMDGTGIPLRAEELAGRIGKQPDGSAKTGEVKLCTIWSAEARDEEGTPIRDAGSVTYSAALESASALDTAAARAPFAQRVWREAARRRFCQAPRRVVLGDGAPWIWNIADEQFPDATQIVGDVPNPKSPISEHDPAWR